MRTIFLLIALTSVAHASPKRIVTLSPALSEMIYAIHADDALVGVVEFSDFPEAVKKKTQVGAFNKPNMEKIISLKPDMVFLSPEGPSDIRVQLERLHLPFTIIPMDTFDHVKASAKVLGDYLQRTEEARAFEKNWDDEFKKVIKAHNRVKLFRKPIVFIEVQNEPLMAAGKKTFINEMIELCGAKNSVTQSGYPVVSKEFIATTHLDHILLADYFPTQKIKDEALAKWHSWTPTKETPVHLLNSDLVSRPGPRLLQGLKQVCEILESSQ